MWNAASINEAIHDAPEYGFDIKAGGPFDWARVKKSRDAYVLRLNVCYLTKISLDFLQHPEKARSHFSPSKLIF
jgi:glutathione reductase (NADPH)